MDNLLLTAAQMRALEQAAIDSGVVTGLELMERAGTGAVDAILDEWPDLAAAPGRAVVLCGPGNNGGDGFVVARVLVGRGWDVEVFLYGDAEKLPPDARVNYERWREVGEVQTLTGRDMDGRGYVPDLTIDAIFGTGLSRTLSWELCDAVKQYAWTFTQGTRVVALDIPSGLSAESGRRIPCADPPEDRLAFPTVSPAAALAIDLTLAFHAPKIGHYLGDAPADCGRLRVVDIGLNGGATDVETARLVCGPFEGVAKASGHKYDHGHAIVLTGGMGLTGAARLAARGALRIGAGLVTCVAPGPAMMECAVQLTAVMLRRCDDAAALADLLEDDRINALCLGPGMGLSDRAGDLIDAALSARRHIALDADALTILAERDDPFAMLHHDCVLTPHGGEFASLFPDIAERLNVPAMEGPAYSKVDATRDAADRAGCTVLFKGMDTVIADEKGNARINAAVYDRAAPWLATAGAGDVLAGIIAGLLARGLSPLDAASSAAWLHVEAARAFGPGLIAEDLPEMLPQVLAALER
ncbi:bifunctional ADP-dependent NAD(P)H-hydrate dehydratase/NAD(P)H-hydrate epimerase [Jannaschia donghaensis]|uniref:Bifunctional NAD(P)H-hydrate repair enzyme n=1 Tax=Jannaschia donghaensis TaxID=420998 RepID=A0A0M6YLE7_9RHOB|nr:bifunctional ADP-dependent NAD(P)H-hydrate dehydratase/NAD(P)H-hydrate epimerase [Jannaschia donghaensis]CTQ51181.1 Nicotinamide nucleotide repair protein [Jannaschia donghaensis]